MAASGVLRLVERIVGRVSGEGHPDPAEEVHV